MDHLIKMAIKYEIILLHLLNYFIHRGDGI